MISLIYSSVILFSTLLWAAKCATVPDNSAASQNIAFAAFEVDLIDEDKKNCTSSKYQQSMERKLVMWHHPKLYRRQLGGNRFYTSNLAQTAAIYAERTIGSNFLRRHKPLLCRIYIKSSTLPNLPKTYIPESVEITGGWKGQLWMDEKHIHRWESLLFSESSPERILDASSIIDHSKRETVRFSKMKPRHQAQLDAIGIQAAWPEEAVKKMIAKCETFDIKSKNLPDSIGYKDILERSQSVNFDSSWGRVRGSTFFNPVSPTPERINFDETKDGSAIVN
ncbi:hypothetical protein BKA69DRAFT_1139171 [Paraphysoderma sedebokerense]|nr:hypothetical protein BKA69DRAFT_1139171 [Paraphysoderma sedebokerense]